MRNEINHMREALISYIEATYHLSNPKTVNLRRDLLANGGVAQIPYIESTPAYVGDRPFDKLDIDPQIKAFLAGLATSEAENLLFDPPYEHQALALEIAGKPNAGGSGIVVTTGTGSGKTESFLLPVLARLADEAAHRPDNFSHRAVRALLLYPMNALVNDQLGRLRSLFGSSAVRKWFGTSVGRPAKFGRYTGRTLYPGMRDAARDQKRLKTLEYYLKIEDGARNGDDKDRALLMMLRSKGRWPAKPDSFLGAFDGLRDWYGKSGMRWDDANGNAMRAVERPQDPELLTRHEIQTASPDLLVTNYSMLEYMLLRPIESDIFASTRAYYEAHPEESFFLVLDEAHLYRGANGTEVAYLIRRLLDRLGLPTSRVVFIATSASFSNSSAAATFVSRLTGLETSAITTLTGNKRAFEPSGEGPVDVADAFSNVPLGMLQSARPSDRSAVLTTIAKVGKSVGATVKLKRVDSGTHDVIATVRGLATDGTPLEEAVLLDVDGSGETVNSFLVVDHVDCSEGAVSFQRRFDLGTARPDNCEWTNDDLPAALAELISGMPVVNRLRNITSGAESPTDPIISPGAAWSIARLPETLFPQSPTDVAIAAVDALLELASLARPSPNASPLLPARIHMLFRGLPGLWACTNPQCDEIPVADRGGPTGALYAEARQNCACGAQVYELHSCRDCGLSVVRANIGAPTGIEHLWQDNGRAYAGDTDAIAPINVCLEDPLPQKPNVVRAAYLDPASGRIGGGSPLSREVWLPPPFEPKLFENCPRCNSPCGDAAAGGISDLRTKGEQPFKELISVQVLEQPPRPESTAPLKGRKALIFSDGRQTASRLAGEMKTYSFRDSLRPLLVTGMQHLRSPIFTPSLDDAPLAIALGAQRHGVRLRPSGDDDGAMEQAGASARYLIDQDDADSEDFRSLTTQTSDRTPLSVFQSIYAVLQDNHTGLSPLALATLRPKLTKTEKRQLHEALRLPVVPGLSDAQARDALIELWLWQAMRKHAIKLRSVYKNIEGAKGNAGIRPWNGRFSRIIGNLLGDQGLKAWATGDFANICEPALRAVFSDGAPGEYYVKASKVSLDAGGTSEWLRCERCTTVSPRNPLIGDRCGYCAGTAKTINPASDTVFRSRKSFYRRLWERLDDPEDGYAPHQLIAEEHSAALNDSGLANAMSRNEAYELRFQDIPIEQDGRVGPPIDILSCTTTMEVGIDIGGLTAVALRNVPPGRANYQQRAGRAGRRGAGLSTVVMFCGADSHDQSFFRDPGPIVAGPAPDPILNLDNLVIARRQALAYLLGRFQQDRIDTVGASSDVFSSLGKVSAFLDGGEDVFSLRGLRQWIAINRDGLRSDVERLFTASCPALDSDALLDGTPDLLEHSLIAAPATTPPPLSLAKPGDADDLAEDEEMEDGTDDDHGAADNGKVLDRLFDAGLLPKYAFPTDVATFSVFEDPTDPWNPKRRYSPQQGLNAALSQYAPGHEVWVDGNRYISLGLYAEREDDRFEAYRTRRLYFQCQVCGFAELKNRDQGHHPEQTRNCPACHGRATLGPARQWVRPTGFAHPPSMTALPPEVDAGTRTRPTRATLDSLQFPETARIDGKTWPIGTRWEGWSDNRTLVVTNRGSLDTLKFAFNYCPKCGRIEPGDFDPEMRRLMRGQSHPRPRPNRSKEPELCDGNPTKIVLGNEFDTDVAVFRLGFPLSWSLDPDRAATTIAARSAVEALRRAACAMRDFEPNDIDGDFRFAPASADHQFIDLYLYDQAAGGAGFVKAAAREPHELVDAALALLDGCDCDDSCYQCLRSYRNRYDHALLDRRIGADLLRAGFKGMPLELEPDREDYALDRLATDLEESGAEMKRVDGGLVDAAGKIICLAHPFVEGLPCSSRARSLAVEADAVAVDILLVLRALPIASSKALSMPNVDLNAGLRSDPGGVPELTVDQVESGDLMPASGASRFSVSDAKPGDFLFKLDANTLSGKDKIAKGTMCLFRPFVGEPEKTDVYLIRRADGEAFGATRAGWTAGKLQVLPDNKTRVRYPAASHHMECSSELVQPSDVLIVMAKFVRAVH